MKWLHGFRRRLLLKLVAAMVATCLPVLSLFPHSILPAVHEMLRTDRVSSLQHATETAMGAVEAFHEEELAGRLTREQAQAAAATAVKRLRSGEDKECFWIDPSTRSD